MEVRYDSEVDILTVYIGKRIAVSSCVEECLIADYGSEDSYDVVGIEFLAAGKLIRPFCARSEAEAIKAQKVAVAMAPLEAAYDMDADILTIQSGRDIEFSLSVGNYLIAHLGYENSAYKDRYHVVGFELRNASECLAPWFRLNRKTAAVSND